jgi:hypothetical protein
MTVIERPFDRSDHSSFTCDRVAEVEGGPSEETLLKELKQSAAAALAQAASPKKSVPPQMSLKEALNSNPQSSVASPKGPSEETLLEELKQSAAAALAQAASPKKNVPPQSPPQMSLEEALNSNPQSPVASPKGPGEETLLKELKQSVAAALAQTASPKKNVPPQMSLEEALYSNPQSPVASPKEKDMYSQAFSLKGKAMLTYADSLATTIKQVSSKAASKLAEAKAQAVVTYTGTIVPKLAELKENVATKVKDGSGEAVLAMCTPQVKEVKENASATCTETLVPKLKEVKDDEAALDKSDQTVKLSTIIREPTEYDNLWLLAAGC